MSTSCAATTEWRAEADLVEFVRDRFERRLQNYESIRDDVRDHHETEVEALAGGYSYRQVLELVQNAADAILEQAEINQGSLGRISLRLFGNRLYAANTGAPLSREGIVALLSARSSSKRQNQIGRFGIGFKSLLGLAGPIDLFSRSVSIRFDPERSRHTIRNHLQLASDHPAPGLRLAWVIDAKEEIESDPVFRELAEWATTVVRIEIGQQNLVTHVQQEFVRFPAEFLLFLAADVLLELQSGSEVNRKIQREQNAQTVKLIENAKESLWHVVETRETLSEPEARADATHIHSRDEIPVSWALPLSAREERGRFWAFFPTDTPSRIPGILNAPWKVNSDRTALIHGPYNTFLMESAARLIANSLPSLAVNDDPARPLDIFPRRLDSQDETAAPLVDFVWRKLVSIPIIPNGEGVLRRSSELGVHPIETEELVERWLQLASQADRKVYVHSCCYRGQRLERLQNLRRREKALKAKSEVNDLELDDGGEDEEERVSLERWLEAIAGTQLARTREVFEISKQVLEAVKNGNTSYRLRQSQVIPSADDRLIAAVDAVISTGVTPARKSAVRSDVASDEVCCAILNHVFEVKTLDAEEWQVILDESLRAAETAIYHRMDSAWMRFWNDLRNAPKAVSVAFIQAHQLRVRVRSLKPRWELPTAVVKAGGVIAGTSSSTEVLVDESYHSNDGEFLDALKISSEPRDELIAWLRSLGNAYGRYETEVRSRYAAIQSAKRKFPQWSLLDFLDNGKVLAGASLLPLLGLGERGKLTALLLHRLNGQAMKPVQFGHKTRRDVYEPVNVPSPTCWLIGRFGEVEIGSKRVAIADVVAARRMSWPNSLPAWSATVANVNRLLEGLSEDWSVPSGDLSSLWPAVFEFCEAVDTRAEARLDCYEAAAQHGQVPEQIRCESELLPLSSCYVSSSGSLAAQAQRAGFPVITLSSSAAELWCARGAMNLEAIARIEHDAIAPDALSLLDIAPELAPAIGDDPSAVVISCQHLRIGIGDVETPLPATHQGGKILVDLEQLAARSWQERLTILVHEAINAGWVTGDGGRLAGEIVEQNYVRRRAEVASKPSIEERLLAAVGASRDALLSTFDESVRRAVQSKHDLDPIGLARLALAVHGPTVLAVLRNCLEQKGLRPPNRWGSQEALEFAAMLGFPAEFGGSRNAKRSPEVWASGPMPLGKLHDYQEQVIEQLRELLAVHSVTPARAVLSLPTGSGKTRVVVETAVDCALQNGASLLWIAQTDELCEQAVQSFRQVWASRGRPWVDLRICRLWGGNPNPIAGDPDIPTVIVASIQTLASRISTALPAWIRSASLVVIDEAHHAIAPSYTRLLDWLTGRKTEERQADLPPLLGLSATPFRGRNEEESHRLARRFDGRLYPGPEEQAELYQRLQAKGILSEILTEPLNYEEPFVLTTAEREQIKIFDEFPDAAAQRMGENGRRNEAIVRTVSKYATNGRVLLFANSVWHATHLAALLQLQGIQAAAVHGGTETSARQYFIRQFQNGLMKVLCNYGVLTTGFDAPKTDVIIISRPVFSPLRYMQMVGRGLRGERNGGTATCHVITVLDNILEYRDRLAYYTYFTPYFSNVSSRRE